MHNERCTSGSEGGPEKPGGRKADRALRSDPTAIMKELNGTENKMQRILRAAASALLAVLLAAGVPESLRAEGSPPKGVDAEARRLVEDVLGGADGYGGDTLGEWSRSVIGRALGRAGETARQTGPGPHLGTGPGAPGSLAPLPAERHARSLGGTAYGRNATAEILVFTSLSVPAASWRQWAHDAARSDAALVLRGVGEGGLPGTAKRIADRLGGAEAGVAIDPRLFRLFGIDRVPAVVVVPGGVPPCRSRGCAEDPAPPHDRIAGNIGLVAGLQAVADEGTVARDAARRHLERLEREQGMEDEQ